jgi:ComF family protein
MASSAFALVFPAACPICGQEHAQAGWVGLCESCWRQIRPWSGPICAACGLPLASLPGEGAPEFLCGVCRRSEYEFDFARSYGIYSETLRSAILLLKFTRRERLGLQLGKLLAPLWSAHLEFRELEDPVLVPVPLHRARQRERGFNQAEALAQGLVRVLRGRAKIVPRIETRCLERARPTVPQTGLSFKARQENVRGVFKVTSSRSVSGRDVVLADDVMTTGATLSSCASALKSAKARRVYAVTLARATPQFPDVGAAGEGELVDDFGSAKT